MKWLLAVILLVVAGCASEDAAYQTTYSACVSGEYAKGACAYDPLIAICIAQYSYNRDICYFPISEADWFYTWCLENTPGSWLGDQCPSFVCTFRTETTRSMCGD